MQEHTEHSPDFRERRASRLYEEAVELFRQRGYDATSIAAIADAAGVSRRTFFNYFASKDHVLAELHRRVTLLALERLDMADVSALKAIRSSLMAFAEALEGEHALVRALLRVIFSSALLEDQDRADVSLFVPKLTGRIRAAQRAGELAGTPRPSVIAGHLMAIVTGALTHWALTDPSRAGKLTKLLGLRLELALVGLGPGRAPVA